MKNTKPLTLHLNENTYKNLEKLKTEWCLRDIADVAARLLDEIFDTQ